ncbi:sulfite exporter TauE/SafE family protein [Methyloversatilis thermotolerans]|uniref:sulfite exporter TauE/SafE family protein n=1 Tax=Methyloversatilis thermotolerans TaxID=1346290 RepID=UPI000477A2C0|nr:sulfite exporter TauE/SafE family protein [Methyloversatilis thermotolerans]
MFFPSLEFVLACAALGAVAGVFAGMLGIGGGTLLVPVLVMLFENIHVSPDHILHMALGTAMAAIVASAAISLRTHHAHGAIDWHVVRLMTVGVLLGTALGTWVARLVSVQTLSLFFAAFVFYVAINMLVGIKPKPSRQLPGPAGLIAAGGGIGMVSALVAVGGGAMTVPFLTWCNRDMRHAIATSAALGLPIAVGGTAGYIWNGVLAGGLPPHSVGYVHLPALLAIVATSLITTPMGARAAHRLPVSTLKRTFSLLLVVLAVRMLWKLWTAA